MKREPEIIINGINISTACVMTIRVALEVFVSDLKENGLGGDENGKSLVENYIKRIKDIQNMMHIYE